MHLVKPLLLGDLHDGLMVNFTDESDNVLTTYGAVSYPAAHGRLNFTRRTN
jgi:hypothetical protein